MAARHNDTQLRIRIQRLTANSAACRRFIKEHDKLTGTARIERHIDVVRMGQMMLDMDLSKELAFIDDEIWSKMSPAERLQRFFEVMTLKGKLPAELADSIGTVDVPVIKSINEIPPQTRSEEPEAEPQANALPQSEKPRQEAEVKPQSGSDPVVKTSDDGATHITQTVPSKLPKVKGLGGGA